MLSSEQVAKSAERTLGGRFHASGSSGVPVIDVKLPAEMGYLLRWCDDVNVVPPSRGRASHALTLLCIRKQFREAQSSGWTRVIATNVNNVRTS